jgi:hypothetical protein
MSMRLPRWLVATMFLTAVVPAASLPGTPFAPSRAHADDPADPPDAARTAVEALAAANDTDRAFAAERVAKLGPAGAAEVARSVATLDDRALKACAEALVKAGWRSTAVTFVRASRSAPPAQAKRLLELAHAVNPIAGVSHTREETAAEVRHLLDVAHRARCSTGCAEEITLLGHDAVEPLLAAIGDGDPKSAGDSTACNAVELLAEKGDLPAIRERILQGKVNLVDAVVRMRKEGVPEASEVLFDVASAGRVDSDVMRALVDVPDRARVLAVVNRVVESRPDAAARHRATLAWVYERLEARESIPTLVSWVATSEDCDDFVAIANALVHFGERKGVGLLVKIASERPTWFPCRPSTPEEQAAASAPGRLCPKGFDSYDREHAAKKLAAIAGKDVFDMPEDVTRFLSAQGRDHESDHDFLDRAAAAYRTWWAASRDRIRFDAAAGRWVVGG